MVIVSTPQDLSLLDAKGYLLLRLTMFPCSVIENMSYFVAPIPATATISSSMAGCRVWAASRAAVLGELPLGWRSGPRRRRRSLRRLPMRHNRQAFRELRARSGVSANSSILSRCGDIKSKLGSFRDRPRLRGRHHCCAGSHCFLPILLLRDRHSARFSPGSGSPVHLRSRSRSPRQLTLGFEKPRPRLRAAAASVDVGPLATREPAYCGM